MKIIASFDDGTVQDLLVAKLVEKYKIETIFYFPAAPQQVNEPKGRISLSSRERQQIASKHEIGSHTISHPLLTRITPDEAKREITVSRDLLYHEFKQSIDSFCYPRGYANPELQILVKEAGYKTARSTVVGYLFEPENPYFQQTTVHVGNNRKEYAGLSWFDYAMKMLQFTDPKSVYHIWGHSWELDEYPNGFDLLERLFKAIKEFSNGRN